MSRVILVCGPAGSGKSTHAARLERDGFVRLSFDEEAWARGYREHPLSASASGEVHAELQRRLVDHVCSGHDVVVDTSFWSRSSRDAYRTVLGPLGVEPVVHYLDSPRDVVLARLATRRNASPHDVVVAPERAIAYFDGFEVPTEDEGPLVLVSSVQPERDRVAGAVLVRDSKVLLGLRSRARRWFPGVWDLPGGHIEAGETPLQAVVREIREELGVELDPAVVEPVGRITSDSYEMDVFVARAWHGELRNAAPDEHDELRFVTIDEAATLDFADEYLLRLLGELAVAEGSTG